MSTIKYSLVKSSIPKISGVIARVERGDRISLDQIADNMAKRTGLSKVVIQAVLQGLEEEVVTILCQGNNPDLGLGIVSINLGGVFESPLAVITPANADLRLSITPSSKLRQKVKNCATYQKIPATVHAPLINTIYDVSLATFGVFTPGGIIRLTGDNLDFDESAVEEGVFLKYGKKTLRLSNYGRTGNKLIEGVVPKELFTGQQARSILSKGFRVVVRTTYGTQTLREGTYRQPIYRASFGGTVFLLNYQGVTGEGQIRAFREEVGTQIRLAYEEPETSTFGTAVAVSGTKTADYILPGSKTGNSLTVRVEGSEFYKYIERSGIVDGESLNLEVEIF